MSTENDTPVEQVSDDLDAFSVEFFGQNEAPAEPTAKEEDEPKPVVDATDEDTHEGDDDTVSEAEDEVETPPEEPKQKKNRFQERIDELTKAKADAQREAEAFRVRLEKLEQESKPATAPKVEADIGPQPDDLTEDGAEKYPLGEFDPNYIKDLTRHTLKVERDEMKAQEQREVQQRESDAQRAALQTGWEEKLGPAKERYPDFQAKGEQLLGTFQDIDPAYGEYLTTVLMGMEYGPDVLYDLANNPAEASKIVKSGPTMATIALGRLEAKYAMAAAEKVLARPKVSSAPTPPPVNKGSSAAKSEVADDTDDLDAFASKFFPKKQKRG